MQEDIRNENTPDAPARHRRSAGSRTRVVIAAAALAGLGLGGAAFAATGDDDPATPAAVSLDAQARAEAADRADRSARESTAPVTPSASPTPSPTKASPTAKPSPKATTAKPTPKKTSKPKPSWVIPMKGAAITSCYGPRWGTLHAGIDFALPAGTPVRAAFGGTVTKAGDVGDGYGISVVIDHGNGYLTQYAHLSTAKVGVGDKVGAGETIGLEGSTGDSTGPHLHFEVHQGQMWNQIDPAPFLRARGVDVAC
ncbi:Murein DD-endopeptidase MepM and murein hydrolase activator NlpD, contain LysM domain [Micromonospora citrea]|uniref:Murein DD-endopeptidase MepM and murein hydrolase activator NlpD, contain LysM domain n=1 Tax=Micromonospora citrea TaxID=47855 RepID=A0A1C6VFU2_9ACTN|nr:M23 family metallopeptidase [Micromonospora citrea]SCL65208.1 Murein DD-endopeptidase MepM and murein hydrolase activator NlpD, contain LysM domain [Micromonospora citrea]